MRGKYFDVENMGEEKKIDFEKRYSEKKINMCLKRRCIIIVVQMSIF